MAEINSPEELEQFVSDWENEHGMKWPRSSCGHPVFLAEPKSTEETEQK